MKIKIKFVLAVLFFSLSSLNAGLVNAISALVENEPITYFEIYDVSDKLKVSTREAFDILVRQKLEDAQIKNLSIKATNYEIKSRIENIAKQNSMTLRQFKEVLSSQKINFENYQKEIARQLKQEKLYKRIFAQKISAPDESDLKRYYEQNKERLSSSSSFNVTRYSSKARYLLEEQRQSLMSVINGVDMENEQIEQNGLDPKLSYMFNSMKINSFTPILEDGAGNFLLFYLNSKDGQVIPEYESSKDLILRVYEEELRKEAIGEYFDKLKVKANIKIIRYPN